MPATYLWLLAALAAMVNGRIARNHSQTAIPFDFHASDVIVK